MSLTSDLRMGRPNYNNGIDVVHPLNYIGINKNRIRAELKENPKMVAKLEDMLVEDLLHNSVYDFYNMSSEFYNDIREAMSNKAKRIVASILR
jgi:hypothetical protein